MMGRQHPHPEEGGQVLEAGRGTSRRTRGYAMAFWLRSRDGFLLPESQRGEETAIFIPESCSENGL